MRIKTTTSISFRIIQKELSTPATAKISLILTFIVLQIFNLNASCFGKKYTLTEILANQDDEHHIFTCRILKTYSNGGHVSIAEVVDIYKGNPLDTVRIHTGGNTFAGGTKLKPNTSWIIISKTANRLNYTATICHNLSKPLTESDQGCMHKMSYYGEQYIPIIKEFQEIKKQKYSGYKEFTLNNNVICKAHFMNGIAAGKWVHSKYKNNGKEEYIRYEIEYHMGKIEGETNRYQMKKDSLIHYSKEITINGKISKKSSKNYFESYNYKDELCKKTTIVLSNTNGDTTQIINHNYYQTSDHQISLHYRHGYYINKIKDLPRDSISEGYYYKGAKVGLWEYFNESGAVIKSRTFPYPDTTLSNSTYKPDGTLHTSWTNEGNIIKLTVYNKIHTAENYINPIDSTKIRIIYRKNGSKTIERYHNNKLDGRTYSFDSSGKLRYYQDYRQGVKHGYYKLINDTGELSKYYKYENGIESTIIDHSYNAPMIDGFKNGYNIQFSLKDGHRMYEGELWQGYSIGIHYRYQNNQTIKTYYSDDKMALMDNCYTNLTIKKERYNIYGELIGVEEY